MSLFNQIKEQIRKGGSFSADYTGIIIFKPLESLCISCPRADEGMIAYVTQMWASKSIHQENPFITYVVTDTHVKIYYK